MIPRIVNPEILDALPESDPSARRSRRDLRRVHRVLGSRRIVTRVLSGVQRLRRESPRVRILELGAGDGQFLGGVARDLQGQWGKVEVDMLDRLDLVEEATIARFATLGWSVRPVVGDVLAWVDASAIAGPRWDVIIANLFLHHFEGAPLAGLLGAIEARTDLFLACEPRRSMVSRLGSHLIGALGVNAVTRQDAVSSVHAGFRGSELADQWPGSEKHWQLAEYAAGPFSHCFVANRRSP